MSHEIRAMMVVQNVSVGRILYNELSKRRIDFEVKFHPEKGDNSMAFFVDVTDMKQILEVTEAMKAHIEAAEEAEKNEAADADASAADAVLNALKNVKG